MCVVFVSFCQLPDYPLVLASNRDEFYQRPTTSAQFWNKCPGLLSGKDLQSGGTWLGFHRNGRFAALTNYRQFPSEKNDFTSRGWLVRDYLCGIDSPKNYLEKIQDSARDYDGFNLLLGQIGYAEAHQLWYYSNRQNNICSLDTGLYGLSNHLLDTPWPKVVKGKQAMKKILDKQEPLSSDSFFAFLADSTQYPDEMLPDTGIGIEWERLLSSIFIESPTYGTRTSTAIVVNNTGEINFAEKTIVPSESTPKINLRHFNFKIRKELKSKH